jgi:hypothetical protein
MSLYSISLFLHIAGALGLFAVLGLEWAGLTNLRHATQVGQAREWVRLQLHDPVLSLSLRVRTALFMGIVFIMAVRPSGVGALAAMGLALVVGLAASLPAWAAGRGRAPVVGSQR